MSNTLFTNFSTELKKQIGIWYEIKWRKLLSQIIIRLSFIFKENHVFIEEEDNTSDKVVIVEEELDGIAGAQLVREGGEISSAFFKNIKNCPGFANNALILGKSVLFLRVSGLISHYKMQFYEYLGEKTPRFFPVGSVFCMSYIKNLWKCRYSKKPPLPQKISGCAPVLIQMLLET